jgi:hypothetical protein
MRKMPKLSLNSEDGILPDDSFSLSKHYMELFHKPKALSKAPHHQDMQRNGGIAPHILLFVGYLTIHSGLRLYGTEW